MPSLPGMPGDVYFGSPDEPLPDWRKEMPEGGPDDDDDAEPTEEDKAAVRAILGFDPDRVDDEGNLLDDDGNIIPEE